MQMSERTDDLNVRCPNCHIGNVSFDQRHVQSHMAWCNHCECEIYPSRIDDDQTVERDDDGFSACNWIDSYECDR